MDLSFNCSDSIILYRCKMCVFRTNEKTHYLLHNCAVESKSEVIYVKYEFSKCLANSYFMLRSLSHAIKDEQIDNEGECRITLSQSDRVAQGDQCTARFATSDDLNFYLDNKSTLDDNVVLYKCEKCDWRGKCLKSLNYHLNSKHYMVNKKHKCTECDYASHQSCHLKSHIIRKHTPEHLINWHNCNLCSFRTREKHSLNKHFKWLHISEDQLVWHKCDFCDFKSRQRCYLKYHLEEKHLEAKSCRKHKCNECTYEARSKSHLKAHLISKHTPAHLIKWFQCHLCLIKTKTRPLLNKHMKSMHAADDQRNKFVCQGCKAGFIKKNSLKRHIMSYHSTELNCFECEFTANDLLNLRLHLKNVHSQVAKRFACGKCLYETDRMLQIKRHWSTKHTVN